MRVQTRSHQQTLTHAAVRMTDFVWYGILVRGSYASANPICSLHRKIL